MRRGDDFYRMWRSKARPRRQLQPAADGPRLLSAEATSYRRAIGDREPRCVAAKGGSAAEGAPQDFHPRGPRDRAVNANDSARLAQPGLQGRHAFLRHLCRQARRLTRAAICCSPPQAPPAANARRRRSERDRVLTDAPSPARARFELLQVAKVKRDSGTRSSTRNGICRRCSGRAGVSGFAKSPSKETWVRNEGTSSLHSDSVGFPRRSLPAVLAEAADAPRLRHRLRGHSRASLRPDGLCSPCR